MKRDIDRMFTLTRREKVLNALHALAICAIVAVISAARVTVLGISPVRMALVS